MNLNLSFCSYRILVLFELQPISNAKELFNIFMILLSRMGSLKVGWCINRVFDKWSEGFISIGFSDLTLLIQEISYFLSWHLLNNSTQSVWQHLPARSDWVSVAGNTTCSTQQPIRSLNWTSTPLLWRASSGGSQCNTRHWSDHTAMCQLHTARLSQDSIFPPNISQLHLPTFVF